MADLDIRQVVQQSALTILCTGSRHWKDWAEIRRRLRYWIPDYGPSLVIHGAQVTEDPDTHEKWGADYIVDQIAREMGAEVDPHPADWVRWGKRAGPLRNQEMVDLHQIKRIDVCLAWPLGQSSGTWDCMRRAATAGILVRNYGDKEG